MESKDTLFKKKTTLNCRGKLLSLDTPLVMGTAIKVHAFSLGETDVVVGYRIVGMVWVWLLAAMVLITEDGFKLDQWWRVYKLNSEKVKGWRPGEEPVSFDKQFVRNWLDSSGWDHESPPPPLPPEVIEGTRERYLEAFRRLTGAEPVL